MNRDSNDRDGYGKLEKEQKGKDGGGESGEREKGREGRKSTDGGWEMNAERGKRVRERRLRKRERINS
jgi:hypothetical protein